MKEQSQFCDCIKENNCNIHMFLGKIIFHERRGGGSWNVHMVLEGGSAKWLRLSTRGGGGVKITQNSVHVVCTWPLNKNLFCRYFKSLCGIKPSHGISFSDIQIKKWMTRFHLLYLFLILRIPLLHTPWNLRVFKVPKTSYKNNSSWSNTIRFFWCKQRYLHKNHVAID